MWQTIRERLGEKALFGLSRLEILGVAVAAALAFFYFSPPGPQTLAGYVSEHDGAKLFQNGAVSLSGVEVSCSNLPIVFDDGFPDHAGAFQKSGFIVINPKHLFTRPKVQQLFTFYHECGHMNGIDDEQLADCHSIRTGVSGGWIDADGIDTLCKFWQPLHGDATHLSGPQRCASMKQCFAEATKK